MAVKADVVVVGGAVVDLIYKASQPQLTATKMIGTSTPCNLVRRSMGGVGRNIAEALHRLGVSVLLYSVVGDDPNGELVLRGLQQVGLSTALLRVVAGQSTATYTALLGSDGELAAAAADMSIFDEALTADAVLSSSPLCGALRDAKVVVLEGNVPAATTEALVRFLRKLRSGGDADGRSRQPLLVYDPISVGKCSRVLSVIRDVDVLKPNELEVVELARLVTARSMEASPVDVESAAKALVLQGGVRAVACTVGPNGVVLAMRATNSTRSVSVRRFPAAAIPAGMLVKVTGAGDTFLAALVASLLKCCTWEVAVKNGTTAAALALQASEAISPLLRPELLRSHL